MKLEILVTDLYFLCKKSAEKLLVINHINIIEICLEFAAAFT